jgi:hypothetical protein
MDLAQHCLDTVTSINRANALQWQTPAPLAETVIPATYATMHAPVTDDLIAALDYVTGLWLPPSIYTELLCLKVQAMVMRERAKKALPTDLQHELSGGGK